MKKKFSSLFDLDTLCALFHHVHGAIRRIPKKLLWCAGLSLKNYRKSGRVEISKVSRTKTLLPRKKKVEKYGNHH